MEFKREGEIQGQCAVRGEGIFVAKTFMTQALESERQNSQTLHLADCQFHFVLYQVVRHLDWT